MEKNATAVMFDMLRLALCDGHTFQMQHAEISSEELSDAFRLAHKHDVAHLFGVGLQKADLLREGGAVSDALQTEQLTAVYRYERLQYEFDRICTVLEEAAIPFIPLKGAVMRAAYPEPWMRTSSDIDVLVQASALDAAVAQLVKACGYTEQSRGSHDVALLAKSGQRIELHYDLIEDGCVQSASEILGAVWDTVILQEGRTHCYQMPDELFYFYHIAHMAKHFENGGCGIRPFVDLWLLNHMQNADREERERLLAKGRLLRFAKNAKKLCNVWFDGEAPTVLTEQMESYILRGGVYGNDTNRISVQQQKQGGRLGYALSKIFLPYDILKFHYPILQKHRWLTPVMEVRRWGKLIFCGHMKRTLRELQYNRNISADEAANTKRFLKELGL